MRSYKIHYLKSIKVHFSYVYILNGSDKILLVHATVVPVHHPEYGLTRAGFTGKNDQHEVIDIK